MKQKNIAEYLGVNPSTICRELKRNTAQRGRKAKTFLATNAQRRKDLRHQLKPKFVKFNASIKEQAVEWLTVEKWNPELISFRGNQTGECPVNIEWLYQWIWQS